MYEEDEKYGVIIAFNVNILPSAEDELNSAKERQKKAKLASIIRPSKIRIMPKLVFRHSKPAIAGVEIMSGIIEKGVTLINDKGHVVGRVESMEDNGENLPKVFEKDFEEGDVLYVDMSERNFFAINNELKDKLLDDEILTMEELQEIKQETEDSNWGVINTDWSELDTLDEDEYEDFY